MVRPTRLSVVAIAPHLRKTWSALLLRKSEKEGPQLQASSALPRCSSLPAAPLAEDDSGLVQASLVWPLHSGVRSLCWAVSQNWPLPRTNPRAGGTGIC